jgi:RNA 3'-terminal phosphate cyclase (ATP)
MTPAARGPQVEPLAAGASLPPLDLSIRGAVTSVDVHSFAAGRVAAGAEGRMAEAAAADLRAGLRRLGCGGAPVRMSAVREGQERARGDGSGVLLVAHTSTGCR